MYARIGLDPDGAWHHYLARIVGKPVATSSMLFAGGVAGIYFVFTVPEARRQGIGAAVTWAALHDAKAKGYRIGILGSSPMGYSVYLGMGFEEYCKTAIYEWGGPEGEPTA